jgi:hypothetical protein
MYLTGPQILLKRFAGRLNKALDSLGAPAMPLDRARSFGVAIGVDPSSVSAMLNGFLMPDWDVLLKICAATNRQPGYFLDETVSELPPGTRLIKPLEGGDNIVIRIPDQDLKFDGELDWSYIIAPDHMGYGVVPGDYVISFSPARGTVPAVANRLYLMWSSSRFEILKCTDVQQGRSTFIGMPTSKAKSMSTILPLDSDGHSLSERYMHTSGIEHIGVITMTMATRSAEAMVGH